MLRETFLSVVKLIVKVAYNCCTRTRIRSSSIRFDASYLSWDILLGFFREWQLLEVLKISLDGKICEQGKMNHCDLVMTWCDDGVQDS